jgi:hypothetical protein
MKLNFYILSIISALIFLGLTQTVNAQVQSQPQPGNLSKMIEDKFVTVMPPSEGYMQFTNKSQVDVVYESPTTIMLSGELLSTISPESTTGFFNSGIWAAMDLLKNDYGFKVQQVMTSGVGSVGNPTNVYILMTK